MSSRGRRDARLWLGRVERDSGHRVPVPGGARALGVGSARGLDSDLFKYFRQISISEISSSCAITSRRDVIAYQRSQSPAREALTLARQAPRVSNINAITQYGFRLFLYHSSVTKKLVRTYQPLRTNTADPAFGNGSELNDVNVSSVDDQGSRARQ